MLVRRQINCFTSWSHRTIDLRVDYCIRELEKFYAIAKVMRLGGRIASVRMELLNDADLLIATGTAAYVVS